MKGFGIVLWNAAGDHGNFRLVYSDDGKLAGANDEAGGPVGEGQGSVIQTDLGIGVGPVDAGDGVIDRGGFEAEFEAAGYFFCAWPPGREYAPTAGGLAQGYVPALAGELGGVEGEPILIDDIRAQPVVVARTDLPVPGLNGLVIRGAHDENRSLKSVLINR